jgi:diguanylate cyclase (GGDEF)-like protein
MVLAPYSQGPLKGTSLQAFHTLDVAKEYVRSVEGRRRQVWLRLAITIAVGTPLAFGTQDVWVPFWMLLVLVTQLLENAGFEPLLRGVEPTKLHIIAAVCGSVSTTTAFGIAAPLMWSRGGTEAGAGSVMFLFGGSMMALMAAQGSMPAFVGTVLPYLLVGTAMALSPILLGHSNALSWPLVIGFLVLSSVMCLLWQWSARARRSEILARQEVESGRERAEAAERQVRELAYSDALTGLPNRHAFNEALNGALSGKQPFGLLLLDLNGFKRVNDSFGHPVGDEVLGQVGSRLAICTDGSGFAVRLGGDEFAVIHWAANEESAVELARKIADSIEQPFITRNGLQKISSSVGIALAPIHATEPSELMRRADLALYRSKSTGGAECVVYEQQMELRSQRESAYGQVEPKIA